MLSAIHDTFASYHVYANTCMYLCTMWLCIRVYMCAYRISTIRHTYAQCGIHTCECVQYGIHMDNVDMFSPMHVSI